MEPIRLSDLKLRKLRMDEAKVINGGLGPDYGKIWDAIEELGERMHESYTDIKSGLIDGWKECGCQE